VTEKRHAQRAPTAGRAGPLQRRATRPYRARQLTQYPSNGGGNPSKSGRSPGIGCRALPATPGRRSIGCQRMFGSPLSTPSAAEGGGRRPAFTEGCRTAILLSSRTMAGDCLCPLAASSRRPRNTAVYSAVLTASKTNRAPQKHSRTCRSNTQRSDGFYPARSVGNSTAIDMGRYVRRR
jgi:hypothetical protein